MSRISTPPVIWLGNGWQQKDKVVDVSTAKSIHNIQVFNSPEDVRNRFFPGQREVEIGPGNSPILSPKSAFFIEPLASISLYNRINEYGSMRENGSRLINRDAGDVQSAQWIKKNNLQIAWMKNMPDLSEGTFTSLEGMTHVVDMTDSSYSFPWKGVSEYENFENGDRGARKDHFIAHGFYPLQRIYIPVSEERSVPLLGTIYVKPEEIN